MMNWLKKLMLLIPASFLTKQVIMLRSMVSNSCHQEKAFKIEKKLSQWRKYFQNREKKFEIQKNLSESKKYIYEIDKNILESTKKIQN